jgi:MFS family permease
MPDAPTDAPSHGLAAYRRVLAAPRVAAIATAFVAGGMPAGMGAVALVLYVHDVTGSFAAAGVVAAAFTVGLGITGPLLGRLIDRRGTRPVILPGAVLAAAAMAAVVILGDAGAGPAAMAGVALFSGAATPPLLGVMRRLWPDLVDARDLPTAYAVDAILIEVLFIAGPVLAGVLAATIGPGDGLLVAAAIGSLGAAWFASLTKLRPTPREEGDRHGWAGALSSPGIRLLFVTGLPMGAAFGALDVTLPAFGALHGSSALGGPFAAALAVGSMIAGIVYGSRPHSLGPALRAFLLLSALQALTCLPLLLVGSIPQMFLAAALAGSCVAPLVTVRNQLTRDSAPLGTGTEAFTWGGLAITLGASSGSVLAGPLVEAGGWRAGAVVACALPAVGAAVALLGRDALRPS